MLALWNWFLESGGQNWDLKAVDNFLRFPTRSFLAAIPNYGNAWSPDIPIDRWHGVLLSAAGTVQFLNLDGILIEGSVPDLDLPDLEHLCLA